MTESSRALRTHAALGFLLTHEPEANLPHLAFHRMDGVLRKVAGAVGPLLAPWLATDPSQTAADETAADEPAARAAGWVARIVLAYLTAPAVDVDLCRADSTRRLVRQFVLPGLAPAPRPEYPPPT